MCSLCNFQHSMQPSVALWCSPVFSRWQWHSHVWEHDPKHVIREPIAAGPWLLYGSMRLFGLTPDTINRQQILAIKDVLGPMLMLWLGDAVKMPRAGLTPFVPVVRPFTVEDIRNATFVYKEAFDAMQGVHHG